MVGTYVGAVAKVGLTVVQMVQVSGLGSKKVSSSSHTGNVKAMDDNDETAGRLGTHVYRLSNVLEKFSKKPCQPERSKTMNEIDDLQRLVYGICSISFHQVR